MEMDAAKGSLRIEGPKGSLATMIDPALELKKEDAGISVIPRNKERGTRALWGMSRAHIASMVEGVHQGFSRELHITGVGFRAQMQGKNLKLALGFSHDIVYTAPEGVQIACPRAGVIVVSGIDKQKVGQVCAEIRAYKKPEPYKGKGIAYAGEYIYRKEGKKK